VFLFFQEEEEPFVLVVLSNDNKLVLVVFKEDKDHGVVDGAVVS
jgi:hypothetical protein